MTVGVLAAWPAHRSDGASEHRLASSPASPVALRLPEAREQPGSLPARATGHAAPVVRLGTLEMVRVDPAIPSLSAELVAQQRDVSARGGRLLLIATVVDCAPCEAVLGALAAPPMQRALAATRVVAVGADDFAIELARLGVPIDAFPGIALIGDGGRVVDYIHGGEWDDDVPRNIAPVLESFVGGTYDPRRDRWHARRDDEISL